jgi:hypothetical protein
MPHAKFTCTEFAAARRLAVHWHRNCEKYGEDYQRRVNLPDVVQPENVKVVARLDLLREYDGEEIGYTFARAARQDPRYKRAEKAAQKGRRD